MDKFEDIVASNREKLAREAVQSQHAAGALAHTQSERVRLGAAARSEAHLVAQALLPAMTTSFRLQAAREEDFRRVRESLGPEPKVPELKRGMGGPATPRSIQAAEKAREQIGEYHRNVARRALAYAFPVWDLRHQTRIGGEEEPWDGAIDRKTYLGHDGLIYTANTLSIREPIPVFEDTEYLESLERINAVRNGLGLLVVRHNIHVPELGV